MGDSIVFGLLFGESDLHFIVGSSIVGKLKKLQNSRKTIILIKPCSKKDQKQKGEEEEGEETERAKEESEKEKNYYDLVLC